MHAEQALLKNSFIDWFELRTNVRHWPLNYHILWLSSPFSMTMENFQSHARSHKQNDGRVLVGSVDCEICKLPIDECCIRDVTFMRKSLWWPGNETHAPITTRLYLKWAKWPTFVSSCLLWFIISLALALCDSLFEGTLPLSLARWGIPCKYCHSIIWERKNSMD